MTELGIGYITVLILLLMEYPLGQATIVTPVAKPVEVLILLLMEYPLGLKQVDVSRSY